MSLVKRDYKEVDWNVTNEVCGSYATQFYDTIYLNVGDNEGVKIQDKRIYKSVSCYFNRSENYLFFKVRIFKDKNNRLQCKISIDENKKFAIVITDGIIEFYRQWFKKSKLFKKYGVTFPEGF